MEFDTRKLRNQTTCSATFVVETLPLANSQLHFVGRRSIPIEVCGFLSQIKFNYNKVLYRTHTIPSKLQCLKSLFSFKENLFHIKLECIPGLFVCIQFCYFVGMSICFLPAFNTVHYGVLPPVVDLPTYITFFILLCILKIYLIVPLIV